MLLFLMHTQVQLAHSHIPPISMTNGAAPENSHFAIKANSQQLKLQSSVIIPKRSGQVPDDGAC
jgi:hypothetical protein